MRRRPAAIVAAVLLALAAGCGDDDEETSATTTPPEGEAPGPTEDADSPAGGAADEERETARRPDSAAKQVARVVREYVRALHKRDGAAVCALLAPGAIGEVELPRERGDCAPSLTASIGYRDPRGLPVWRAARVGEIVSAEVDGDAAKVVATTITLFADREEPSIEDDVVYLARRGGSWLIAKPSTTLYRAVGIADIPPSVLAPP